MLVMWGHYDPSFIVPGAEGYKHYVPAAELHIRDAGHFALDEAAWLTRDFLERPSRQPIRFGPFKNRHPDFRRHCCKTDRAPEFGWGL